jgi:multimeric flavodoxin WrbA
MGRIPTTHNLMHRGVAIHCTLVVRNIVMVACPQPWFTHAVGGVTFTSTATQHGGRETTLFSIITDLLHFGMAVGLDYYVHAGQMTLDEITGRHGATTIAGSDGSPRQTANELQGARYQAARLRRLQTSYTANAFPPHRHNVDGNGCGRLRWQWRGD